MWPFKKSGLGPPEKQTEHHYVLAHVVLRQVAQRDSRRAFKLKISHSQMRRVVKF